MEGRRGRGRGVRQSHNVEGDQESAADQNPRSRGEVREQVATTINRMTNILERLANQPGHGTVNCEDPKILLFLSYITGLFNYLFTCFL